MSNSTASWTAAHQTPLSPTISQSLLRFMSTESVMLSNHLIRCCPLLLLPSIFPRIRIFSNEPLLRHVFCSCRDSFHVSFWQLRIMTLVLQSLVCSLLLTRISLNGRTYLSLHSSQCLFFLSFPQSGCWYMWMVKEICTMLQRPIVTCQGHQRQLFCSSVQTKA